MYAHFYQLAENPFNLTPDPKFHYINESTREAMASILHGIKARKGFITLIGEAGTGKTTLLKRILDEIEGETQVVFVFNPGVSFDELLEFICMELGITTDGRRRLQLLDRLNAHLLAQLTAGRNVVVMIDEAQTLDDSVLEELRLLSNLETAKEKILQILLSGQPELEEKLRRPNLRQLRQRIAVRATLKPMRPDEVGPYVETRLRSAGAERSDFFTPPALRKVWQASRGIPRVVNVVCDNAMMIAFAEGKRRITSGVMSEAIRDLHGQGTSASALDTVRVWAGTPAVRYAAGAALGLALAVPFALSMSSSGSHDSAPAAVAAPAVPADGAQVEARPAPQAPAVSPAAERPVSAVTPQADIDGRMDGTLRDSVKRAEEVARTTAARLYHSDARAVEPNAERELHQSGAVADADSPNAPAPDDGKAIASLDEPVKFDRERATIADPKADRKGLASLQAPLADAETGAFSEEGNRRAQREPDAPPAMPAPKPEQKPVKAGSIELDGASRNAEMAEARAAAEREAAKAAQEKAAQKAAQEKAAQERAAQEKAAQEKAAQERAAQEKAAQQERAAQEKAAQERAAQEKAAQEKAAQQRAEQQAAEAARNAKAAAAAGEVEGPALDMRDPDAAATESLLASAEAAAEARERAGMGAGTPTPPVAAAPSPDMLASAVAPSSELRTYGVDPNEPIVGQLVRVGAGDTVWDIAVAYYGTAGPVTLKHILNSNPTIRDPRHLDVGTHIYLPFQRPEQMVLSGSEGSYRVLLAVSPERSRLAPVRAWVSSFIQGATFDTSVASGAERSYQLQLVGLPSKEAALEFAAQILTQHDNLRQHGIRRSA